MRTVHGGSIEPAPFPERVGRYELLLPIASGGMATVYLGRTTGVGGFERDVALKLTHAHLREDSGFASSLMEEANLAGRIRHPNVVSVLDVGEDPHGVYLVMEYVEGETLAGLVKLAEDENLPLADSVALRIADDMLAGLHAAHELCDAESGFLGLVHRDVTPHNVLVGVDGLAKLTDFGIAKAATRLGVTATGLIKGKVAYMSPEQALGRPLHRTCDVWAAGVVLWELLAGMRLHTATSDAATLLRIVSEPPPRLRSVRPSVARELDEVVAHALEMDPRQRFATAEAFAHALEAAARASSGRAERREVSEAVRRLVDPRLERRRAKVAQVLELRGRLSKITNAALPGPVVTPSSIQPIPKSHFSLLDAGRKLVSPSFPGASAQSETGDFSPALPTEELSTTVPLGGSVAEPTRTETVSVSTASPNPLLRRQRLRRLGFAVAGGAVLAAGVTWIAISPKPPAPPAAAHESPGAVQAASPALTSEPAPRPLTPDDLPLAEPAAGRSVTIAAAAPIATVYVGRRRVEFPVAVREQQLTLKPDERTAWLTVVASDGRRGGARLEPRAERVNVSLATSRTPRSGPGPEPVSLEPAPAPSRGLLNNPYRGQR